MRSGERASGILIILAIYLLGMNAWALPEFMGRFSQDPFSRPEYRNQCSTCHINPAGGGARNEFGAAFEKNRHVVTPEFRSAWPDHFLPSVTAAAAGGNLTATFLQDGHDSVLEINGEHYRLDMKTAQLEKVAPQQAAQLIAASPPPAPAPGEPKLPLRDQPTFDHFLVNLPTTLPYLPGVASMRFTHRFENPVLGCGTACSGIAQLYGLDGFSFSSFGGDYGITRRIAVTLYRSPLDTTIEMGGVFQLLSQKGKEPVSAAVRVSIEGRNNFQQDYTTNLVFPVSRSISTVAELFVVPMVSFNANPFASEALPTDPAGIRRKNQAAVGLGASIRFRPRTAFVMEWTPRVAGYHEVGSHNEYSFGIARTTNGHVFELVLTNTLGTVTSRSVDFGSERFALGFNIYRRIHGSPY